MKSRLLFIISIIVLGATSCIKDEPLNRETDIESFMIKDNSYVDTDIRNKEVFIYVTDEINMASITPEIEVTEGATISPESGSTQDFSKGSITYTVVSQDGNYSKDYAVTIVRLSSLNLSFDFEDWKNTEGYYDMQVKTEEGFLVKLWDSGNPGIAFVNKGKDFPTAPTTDSHTGTYAAKLETLKGNVSIGNIKIPIFSGSLFYGSFSLKEGIAEPRKCLRLGRIHPEKAGAPLTFTGYYKYKVGKPYIYLDDNNNEQSSNDIIDEFSIYSVLYKVPKGQAYKEFLDGITIMDSEKIVARADWKPETANETDTPADKGFIKFTIPFKYKAGEEVLNYVAFDYKLVIMFASSKDGNEYKGGVGSTLIVDDVQVICDK
jgi:hypothetical protein